MVDPTPEDSLVSVVLVSLLPLLVMGVVIAAMFYWYRVYRPRVHSQEWERGGKKRKAKSGGLDCSDVCVIMMDDDGSDSSSTHANSLNHNTEPLPIELDQLVRTLGTSGLGRAEWEKKKSPPGSKTFVAATGGKGSLRSGVQGEAEAERVRSV